MGFFNENAINHVGNNNRFQTGVSDVDTGTTFENNILLPWYINPAASWMNYYCFLGVRLDSGIVVHRPLPQFTYSVPDTLASAIVNTQDHPSSQKGINLISHDQYNDVTQRMAHSQYRFNLRGWARRAGYQIPIPRLLSVGPPGKTVTAVPDDCEPQEAGCVVIANYSGIPMWFARWSLWYTVTQPPRGPQNPPTNLAQGIGVVTSLPTGIQVPISVPDSRAVRSGPPKRVGS